MLFSAVTVAAALAGLMVFPQRFLFSMGIAGVMVALIAAAVALLVLPAVLALLGTRINSLAPKSWRRRSEHADEEITSGFWYRLSNAVMRRPALIATVTSVAPDHRRPAGARHQVHLGGRARPADERGRRARSSDTLANDFPQDRSQPIFLAITAPRHARGAGRSSTAYAAELGRAAGRRRASPRRVVVGPDTWRIDVYSRRPRPVGARARTLVERHPRHAGARTRSEVGGLAASFVDQKASLGGAPAVGDPGRSRSPRSSRCSS